MYDSNLSNSERASDVKDDWAWQSNLRVGNGFQLARDLRLNLGVDLREQVWARFDAFNNLAPGGTASLRYRFGLGRLAPWVLIEDRLAYAFFKEDDRSGRRQQIQDQRWVRNYRTAFGRSCLHV